MRDTERNILSILRRYSNEYTLSNQRALLEIERNHHGYLSINFLHYHDSYKTNNKLVQIHEINPRQPLTNKKFNYRGAKRSSED